MLHIVMAFFAILGTYLHIALIEYAHVSIRFTTDCSLLIQQFGVSYVVYETTTTSSRIQSRGLQTDL